MKEEEIKNIVRTLDNIQQRLDWLRSRIVPEFSPQEKMSDLELVEMLACQTFGVSREQMQSRSRTEIVVKARMVAMYIARTEAGERISHQSVARYFRMKDHGATLHACKRIPDLCSVYPNFKAKVESIRKNFNQSRNLFAA